MRFKQKEEHRERIFDSGNWSIYKNSTTIKFERNVTNICSCYDRNNLNLISKLFDNLQHFRNQSCWISNIVSTLISNSVYRKSDFRAHVYV